MISFQPPAAGSVQSVYVPAGRVWPPTTRSPALMKRVAKFAPVRQTWFQGTTGRGEAVSGPKIVRPRIDGRPYSIVTGTPPTVPFTEAGGESAPSGGRFSNSGGRAPGAREPRRPRGGLFRGKPQIPGLVKPPSGD